MDELKKAFPNVWCPNCGKVRPMEFGIRPSTGRHSFATESPQPVVNKCSRT